jgi:hypothetical protein
MRAGFEVAERAVGLKYRVLAANRRSPARTLWLGCATLVWVSTSRRFVITR